MDRAKEALEIYYKLISKHEKIRLLQDLALDIHNELEAQDQNMHPEIQHKMAEGLMLTKNLIRQLEDKKKPWMNES